MADTQTDVQGDVNGNALSGSFQGSVQTGQNVTVNVAAVPVPPPPDTAGPMERIRFLTAAMMQLQSYFVTDRNERESRQEVQDQRYEEAKEDRTKTRRLIVIVLILVFVSLAIGIFNSLAIGQLINRLGWLW